MKKPTVGETDKLRALTEDPELQVLMEQYKAAPPGDREAALEAFNEKADALYPDWRETIERSHRDGEMLRARVIHFVKNVRGRTELSEFERLSARSDEVDFKAIFSKARKDGVLAKEYAFRLAEAAMDIALKAGPEPEEMQNLRRRMWSDMSRKGGTTPKAEKPWALYARMLALRIPEKDRTLPDTKIAAKLWDGSQEKPAEWAGRKPDRPTFRTLEGFVAKLRDDETFPPRPASARRRRN